MAATIPESFKDLFTKVAFAHLATCMPDGSPQVTPVWVDYDGSHVRVNSAKGRLKDRNMRRDKRVALSRHQRATACFLADDGAVCALPHNQGCACPPGQRRDKQRQLRRDPLGAAQRAGDT